MPLLLLIVFRCLAGHHSFLRTPMQFIQEASEESCDYIVHELQGFLKTDANVVKDYLRHPEHHTRLRRKEQVIVMDIMLEFAEASFRTSCDLFRYRIMREAGIVRNMEEFLKLLN